MKLIVHSALRSLKIQFAMQAAARVESSPALRTVVPAVQVFPYRQFFMTMPAQDRFFRETYPRPYLRPAAAFFSMALMAGEIFAAAEKFDCNSIGFLMIVPAAGFLIDGTFYVK